VRSPHLNEWGWSMLCPKATSDILNLIERIEARPTMVTRFFFRHSEVVSLNGNQWPEGDFQ
jgi:hypothetical protein